MHHIPGIKKLTESKSGILRASVRMEHESERSISRFISLLESSHDKIHIRFCGDMPCNHLACKQVDDNAEIIPFPAGFDISKIAYPYEIGSVLGKLLFEMVCAVSIFFMTFVESGPVS